ncbi:lysylphosphatidylglycerol synthase transmembrane domain-containing protein [Pseudoruegeria sp. SK021]|uniref:lysylphosphatidylglycerol synthase transmembrane domain-containing protein n=1 Tax=Pseudoruegeria sp. SK021 TaxID=1933035 RepID=UPI000A237A87|nr:lysylphosphatidylglycerol synthase transmembrane domain-containing protein [Pseudoruegeria sp. SK021]OSP55307.1 hypothetical protein BV911_07665 [Pseudoruegeria sp. SK021]
MALIILFLVLPIETVWSKLERIPTPLFLWIILIFTIGHFAAAAKWWNLLGRKIPFITAVHAHMAGMAANLCLPGVAGGDAVRAGVGYSGYRDGARVFSGSVVDRLMDLLALACLGLIGFFKIEEIPYDADTYLISIAVVFFIFVGALFVFPPLALIIRRRLVIKLSIPPIIFKVVEALSEFARMPFLLASTFLASIAIQLLFLSLAYRLSLAIGLNVSFSTWCFAWPVAKIVSVLPISLGGLGVREAILAALLIPFGADATQVVAAGLSWQAVLFITGGLSGFILIAGNAGVRWRRKE